MTDFSGMSDEQLAQMLLEAKLKLEQAEAVYKLLQDEAISRQDEPVYYTEFGRVPPIPGQSYEGW